MIIKADMHIHASPGSIDSLQTVDRIIETALRKGLGAIAICDHNSFRGAAEALSKSRSDLTVIPAVEVSTDMGHMLCYFVSRAPSDAGIKPANGQYPFEEVRGFVDEEGGLLIAAHPYRSRKSRIHRIIGRLDGIEVFNGRNTPLHQSGNIAAEAVVRALSLRFTAGSDAHTPAEIGRAYRIFEFDRQPVAADIRRALDERRGKYFGAYSPLRKEAFSGMCYYYRAKKPDKLLRSIAKFGLGLLIDPLKGVRFGTREISRGKEFEI